MIFKIEVEDFWIEDGELERALKNKIINSVTHQIKEDIDEKVKEEINSKVYEFMAGRMSVIINDTIQECVDDQKIKPRGYSESINISEYIKKLFLEDSGWSSPNRHIDKIAKKFGEELKLQYNNAFANQIVKNMKEQSLLKDEVVQILLEKK